MMKFEKIFKCILVAYDSTYKFYLKSFLICYAFHVFVVFHVLLLSDNNLKAIIVIVIKKRGYRKI